MAACQTRGAIRMSTIVNSPVDIAKKPIAVLDRNRGTMAMWMVIATEGSLFISLFCSYFLLGNNKSRWAVDDPPKLTYALILLALLVSSSFVLHWGERQVRRQRYVAARIILVVTILMGLGFLALQSFEYLDHWKKLAPYSDSYGSIFYTITTFHAAHVIVGLLILGYVLSLPSYNSTLQSPYRAYHIAAMYWHFVDVVWILVVLILYLIPNWIVYGH
jgi:heme/copper-type cytochrome/quinol oxidase subunit 3